MVVFLMDLKPACYEKVHPYARNSNTGCGL